MGATQVLRDFLPTKMWRKARTKPKIFISYRRDDCSWFVTALHNKLSNQFGREKVFQDYNHIEAGEDFAQCIHDSVRGCNVFLVVIGKEWLNASKNGVRRLDDPKDFVRLEIAAALKRRRWAQIRGELRVIPVLVDGAQMPTADELPEDLADLANYQAHRIETTEFEVLSDALIVQIRPSVYPWLYRIRRASKFAVLSLLLTLSVCSIWNHNAVVWWDTWQAERALKSMDYEKALESYKAIVIHRPTDRRVLLNLAELYWGVGVQTESAEERNFLNESARKYFRQVLVITEVDEKRMGIQKKLAFINEELKFLQGALNAHDDYLDTYKRVNADDQDRIFKESIYVARRKSELLSFSHGNHAKAKDILKNALDEVGGSVANDHREAVLASMVLAQIYVSLESYSEAEELYGMCWYIFNESKEYREATTAALRMAEMYEIMDKYDEANIWWKASSQLAKKQWLKLS